MREPFILVVEADAGSRQELVRALQRDGCRCVPAAKPDEAVAHLRATPFDLVVWDADTWDIASKGWADWIQASPVTSAVLVSSLERRAVDLGAPVPANVMVLGRPVDSWGLRAAVARSLERQGLARENLELRSALAQKDQAGRADVLADWPTLEVLEGRYVDRVLEKTGGNRTAAAALLGVNRRTLQRLLARRQRRAPDGATS
jgi:DNA-binding NtrC family response regulator